MRYQNINFHREKVYKHFARYPLASISAMFRQLRKSPAYSMIGDYPIIALIISTMSTLGIGVKRTAVRRAMRESKELKGQTNLLRQLLKCQMTTRIAIKMPQDFIQTPLDSKSSLTI